MKTITQRERIKEFLEEFNLTQVDLAKKIGVSKASVSQWIVGKTEPTPQHEKRIALQFPKLNVYWLWGAGDELMIRDEAKVINNRPIETFVMENTMYKDKVKDLERIIEGKDAQIEMLTKIIEQMTKK